MKLAKVNPIKNSNLSVREEPFGILIYNKITKRKFFANNFARDIINACNGKRNILDIFSRLYSSDISNKNYEEFINFLKRLIQAKIIQAKKLVYKRVENYKNLNSFYPYNLPNITLNLKAPLHIYWELTYKCNLNCRHCYVKDRELKTRELSTSECLKIIDELACLKIFEITFSGGEPLMRDDLLDIVRYTTNKKIAALITTNGTLIDYNMANKLKKAGLQAAQVSLDGSNAKTHDEFRGQPGSFEATIKGIKNLVKVKIPVIIATVPTKSNFFEIKKILNLAKKLKVQGYRILECKHFGRGKEIIKNMITSEDYKNLLNWIAIERSKLKDKLFILLSESFAFKINNQFTRIPNNPLIDCPAGRSMCSISPDGFVSPCSYFAFAGITIGNLRQRNLKEIWQKSSLLKKLREIDFSKKKFNPENCLKCKYFNRCGRGCRAIAYSLTNNLNELDPRCLRYL